MVLDQHETSVSLGEEVRQKIRKALLKQHHHQNQKKLANRIPIVRSFADIGRKQSEPHSMDKNGTAPHAPANALFCFFPCICLIILFNGVCLCVPVIITTQSPPSSFSSLWSRFSHSVRNRQVLLCPASSHHCPKCLSAPHKPHPSLSAHPAPDSPLIQPKKPCVPFSKRLSPSYGYHIIPTINPDEETTSGNMIIDSPVL